MSVGHPTCCALSGAEVLCAGGGPSWYLLFVAVSAAAIMVMVMVLLVFCCSLNQGIYCPVDTLAG